MLLIYNFRKQKLFSSIVMGYLVNLTIGLIFTLVEATKTFDDQGTIGCKIKGYLTQYFSLVGYTNILCQKNIISFQATFFWLNVSSFNIWSKLTRGHSGHKLSESKKLMR